MSQRGMKRRLPLFLLFLGGLLPFLALLWVILRSDEFELRWKFRKGQVLRYQITRVSKPGTSRCRYSMHVLVVDSRGVATISCACEAAASRSSSWDYDSQRDKEEPTNAVALAVAARLGRSMTIRIDPEGYVEEVNGIPTAAISKQSLLDFSIDRMIYPHFFTADGRLSQHTAPIARAGQSCNAAHRPHGTIGQCCRG